MAAKILLVDDHAVVRKGLHLLFENEKDLEVIGEAENGQEALDKMRELSPDIIVMDITMPDIDGIEATRHIIAEFPDAKIIALSIHGGKRFVENMLQAGAAGYILKDSAPEELVQAVRTVLDGRQYLSSEVTGLVIAQYVNLLSHTTSSSTKLTEQEQKLILLTGEGVSGHELEKRLSLNAEEVEDARHKIMEKLGLSSAQELVEYIGAQKWFSGQQDIEETIKASFQSGKSNSHAYANQHLPEPLTNREMDTLKLLAQRLYNKEIADKLNVSPETIKTYVTNIYQKLNVGNRREVITKAREFELID